MCNSVFLGKKTIPDAKDGEEVEIMVKGVYHTDEDGSRSLDITQVDGDPVLDADEEDMSPEKMMNQDSNDALDLFIIKTKKKK